MRKVLYGFAVLLLATTAFADINPYNVRQVTIGTGPASELTLQTILNQIYGDGQVNANTDQNTAGMWQLPTSGDDISAPTLRFEEAGNKNSNIFGIWSGDDPSATPTMVPIFNGPASAITRAALYWDAGDPNTLHIVQVSGTGVNAGDFAGINRYSFGFYLQGPGGTFFTADQLNGGNAQAVTYRDAATDKWTFAFEDLPYAGTDKDYNDLVVTAESITPVPEPGVVLLLGVMLLGSLPLGRFLRK
jgi:hypothetical protein